MFSLLSHLFFNILSLSGFMSSLTSIVTDTSTNPAKSFVLLFLLLLVLQAMNTSSITFWNFHSLIHFYGYHISFLTSSPDFLFKIILLLILYPCLCTLALCPSLTRAQLSAALIWLYSTSHVCLLHLIFSLCLFFIETSYLKLFFSHSFWLQLIKFYALN